MYQSRKDVVQGFDRDLTAIPHSAPQTGVQNLLIDTDKFNVRSGIVLFPVLIDTVERFD